MTQRLDITIWACEVYFSETNTVSRAFILLANCTEKEHIMKNG